MTLHMGEERVTELRAGSDLVTDRTETKYVLRPEQATAVAAAISRWLPRHHHGDSRAAHAGQVLTTVYFDTRGRDLYRQAQGGRDRDTLRVRLREYHPLGAGPTPVGGDSALWLELKHRRGNHSTKRRVLMLPGMVHWLFAGGRITTGRLRLFRVRAAETGAGMLDELMAICSRSTQSLEADAVVGFTRAAWQNPGGTLRVTVDHNLAFYAPAPGLWTAQRGPLSDALGLPRRRVAHAVLEVKAIGEPPGWLAEALAAAGTEPSQFSKFEEASRAARE